MDLQWPFAARYLVTYWRALLSADSHTAHCCSLLTSAHSLAFIHCSLLLTAHQCSFTCFHTLLTAAHCSLLLTHYCSIGTAAGACRVSSAVELVDGAGGAQWQPYREPAAVRQFSSDGQAPRRGLLSMPGQLWLSEPWQRWSNHRCGQCQRWQLSAVWAVAVCMNSGYSGNTEHCQQW